MRGQIFLGFWVGMPVSVAVGLYGLVMGVGAAAKGISHLELLIKSFAVFAGASQLVVVQGWGDPIWVLLLATAAVNMRYLMVGLSLQPMLNEARWSLRFAALWYAADENWALTVARRAKEKGIGAGFLLGAGLAVLLCWQLGGQIGLAAGQSLPDPEATLARLGLDFAFPAIFLALTLSFIRANQDWVAVLVAGAASLGFAWLIPEESDYHKLHIIGGALAGCITAALIYAPGTEASGHE